MQEVEDEDEEDQNGARAILSHITPIDLSLRLSSFTSLNPFMLLSFQHNIDCSSYLFH